MSPLAAPSWFSWVLFSITEKTEPDTWMKLHLGGLQLNFHLTGIGPQLTLCRSGVFGCVQLCDQLLESRLRL